MKDALNALSPPIPARKTTLGPPHHLPGRYPTELGLAPHSSDLLLEHFKRRSSKTHFSTDFKLALDTWDVNLRT